MALLEAGEVRAVGALGEVVAQPPPLLATQAPVGGAGDRELGVGAGELVLELLGQGAARAKEECLESGGRRPEDLGDLGVRPTLELAEHDRLPLLGRDLRERGEKLAHGRVLVVVRRGVRDAIVELDLARPNPFLSKPLLDRVAGDRQQPVRGLAWAHSLLQRAVGVQERRLRDVFRVGMVAEDCIGVAIDLAAVTPVEVVHLA